MRYQAPSKPSNRKDHIQKDFFDAISHYLIPKRELTRRHLTLNVNGKKICGYSIVIEDSKYPRNQLMFNMCFVCYPWSRTVIIFPDTYNSRKIFKENPWGGGGGPWGHNESGA